MLAASRLDSLNGLLYNTWNMRGSPDLLLRHQSSSAFCVLFLIFVVVLILPSLVSAQPPADLSFGINWQVQRGSLSCVWFLDSKTGWAAGDGRQILHTVDGGLHWARQPSGTKRQLKYIFFLNGNIGWAGSSDELLATADSGKTWQIATSKDQNFTVIDAIYFVSPSIGWAAGGGAGIAMTADGGKTWQRQHLDEGILASIYFVDANNGWVVGQNGTNGSIYSTNDGGKTWKSRQYEHYKLNAVYFVDRRHGWIVGEKGLILSTSDAGQTWVPQDSRVSYALSAVQFVNPTIGWAAGEQGGALYTADGGKLWQPGKTDRKNKLNSISFVDASHGYAVGEGGIVLQTADGGHSWREELAGAGSDLEDVVFVDESHGWTAGHDGVIMMTRDGGATWSNQRSDTKEELQSLAFVDTERGWAVGNKGTALTTTNGGGTWAAFPLDLGKGKQNLNQVFFVDPNDGWIAGDNGLLFSTTDGGREWISRHPGIPQDLGGIFFLNASDGWLVGNHGVILVTQDGGKTWTKQKSPTTDALSSVQFINNQVGWIAGSGIVLTTENGGKNWTSRPSESFSTTDLRFVFFLNRSMGWVGGGSFDSSSLSFSTDRGENWYDEDYPTDADINAMSFPKNSKTGWAVGEYGTILKGTFNGKYAPYLTGFSAKDQSTGIALSWKVQAPHPQKVEYARVLFTVGDQRSASQIDISGIRISGDGSTLLKWNPAAYGVAEGSAIHYQITLNDPGGYTYIQDIPDSYVYKPWWSRQNSIVKSAIVTMASLSAYVIVCLLVFWCSPLALLWIYLRLPLKDLVALAPSNPVSLLVAGVLAGTGLPYLVRLPRVRRAWVSAYRASALKLSDLDDRLKKAFLQEADVLDAWVERHEARARGAYGRLAAVEERKFYIQLPLRVGSRSEGQRWPDPKPDDFRPLFAGEYAILAVIGEGGCGKSTLAFQLGRWALADSPAERICPHKMIPVVIEQEIQDILAVTVAELKGMLGTEDIDPDAVANLLRYKRLLIIVDALSERGASTQQKVQTAHQCLDLNALVVTSRRSLNFGTRAVTELRPEMITLDRLVFFMAEYLRRIGAEDLFPARESLKLADRLLALAEREESQLSLTPLLVKLYLEQAATIRKSNQSIDLLPISFSEIVLDYLRRTNPSVPGGPEPIENDVLIRAVRVLGWCSLGSPALDQEIKAGALIPRDFVREAAAQTLDAAHLPVPSNRIISSLISTGVIKEHTVGGTAILRFTFDPVAEYTGALHVVDRLRGDATAWTAWFQKVVRAPGAPLTVQGFLIALDDCIEAGRSVWSIPLFELASFRRTKPQGSEEVEAAATISSAIDPFLSQNDGS